MALQHQVRIFKYSFVLSIRSMKARSFRTFLTVVGILIGITTFTALMSIGVGMRMQIYEILSQFAGASMIVMSKLSSTRPTIPGTVENGLSQIDGINYTAGLIEDFVDINGESAMLTGIQSEKMEFLLGLQVISGVALSEAKNVSNACVIDATLQERLGVNISDTLLISSDISATFIELTVVGVVEPISMGMGFGFDFVMCYTELSTMQNILVTSNVQIILVGLEEGADTDAISEAITLVYPEAEVITEEEILVMMEQIVGIINGVLMALSAISLVVGGLMIMSTMTMSVLERTREIGIMKSIGAKRPHVLTIFLTEAFLISLIGGALGALIAVGGVLGLSQVLEQSYGIAIPHSFEPWIFITGMVLAVVIGLLSGAYPAWQAASVKPVEALRYE